jgi:hypothetical protein
MNHYGLDAALQGHRALQGRSAPMSLVDTTAPIWHGRGMMSESRNQLSLTRAALRKLETWVVLITLSLAGQAAQAVDGIYFFAETGHWYEAVQVPAGLTWNEAYTNSVLRGGYLCTITNASEDSFVASLVDISYYSELSIHNDILGPWLGGFRHANQSTWQWLSGEAFIYSNWCSGQPDGYGGSEQRLQFYNRASIGSTWGDHPGDPIPGYSLPRGYIVEYDRPMLTAARSNGATTVSWPLSASGWALETTPALAGDLLAWNTVPAAEYQTNATSLFIVTSNLTGNAFYRLRY